MTENEFRQQVVDVMCTVLPVLLERPGTVTEHMKLVEELGLNSSLGLELLLELEEQLQIFIDVEQLDEDQMRTVADMATFVATHSRPA